MSLNSKIKVLLIVVVIFFILISCDAKKKRKLKKSSKGMVLRHKETNPVNFIRLATMRLIYGLATRVGLGEQISEALGGVFVPPGVEDDYNEYDDYGNGGIFRYIDPHGDVTKDSDYDDDDDLEILDFVSDDEKP